MPKLNYEVVEVKYGERVSVTGRIKRVFKNSRRKRERDEPDMVGHGILFVCAFRAITIIGYYPDPGRGKNTWEYRAMTSSTLGTNWYSSSLSRVAM